LNFKLKTFVGGLAQLARAFDWQDRISDLHHFISVCISYHYKTSNPDFFTPFYPVFLFLWQIFWQKQYVHIIKKISE
jgi:hypothetical protein